LNPGPSENFSIKLLVLYDLPDGYSES